MRMTKPIANGSPQSQRVGGDRDDHRGAGRDDLELEQEAAELHDQEAERDDRRRELLQQVDEAAAGMQRLVAALAVLRALGVGQRPGLGRLVRLVAPFGLVAHDPLPIHSSPPS